MQNQEMLLASSLLEQRPLPPHSWQCLTLNNNKCHGRRSEAEDISDNMPQDDQVYVNVVKQDIVKYDVTVKSLIQVSFLIERCEFKVNIH